ncbi:hypothetical protein Avbf_12967 [Armadillidium vulgare]|nr:hypothetical protein Avbf_12967 [Armadillidium vulgare]
MTHFETPSFRFFPTSQPLIKPSGYGEKWNGWYGPSGRKEHKLHLSKSKKYKTLLKNSLTSSAIKKYNRNLFKNLNQLILDAEIICGPVPENATKECNDPANPCLFHIPSDPCEYHDVSHIYPQRVKLLQETLEAFNKTAVPPGNKPWDPKANPVYWNYAWTDWQDFKIIPSFNSKLIRPPPAEDDNGFWL